MVNVYEVYDKFNECKFSVWNVERIIETKHTFKFKYTNGTYSEEYLKGNMPITRSIET